FNTLALVFRRRALQRRLLELHLTSRFALFAIHCSLLFLVFLRGLRLELLQIPPQRKHALAQLFKCIWVLAKVGRIESGQALRLGVVDEGPETRPMPRLACMA